MYFFDKKLSLLCILFIIPLLFLPKINLISFKSETAGIRIDDLLLFGFALLLGWSQLLLRKQLHKVEGWIFALTLFSIFSFICNRFLYHLGMVPLQAKVFYTVRLFEYFLFFYMGALAAQTLGHRRVVKAFFLWNVLLMILQKLGWIGALTVGGYMSDVSGRVQGVASFPSEMGLLLNLLFCYLIYEPHQETYSDARRVLQSTYLYGLFFVFGIFVVLTGNRISIVALIVCFLFKLKSQANFRSLHSLLPFVMMLSLLAAGIVFVVMRTQSVYERSADLFSLKNFELIKIVWSKIDLIKDPVTDDVVEATHYDMSWWMRIHKWMYVLKAYVNHPECYLQGLGPGCAWSALDGGWLRILTEYGLIGAFIFWRFFSSIYHINPQTKWMMIAFGINMIFFDAYLAYKTMSFLLFTAGYEWQTTQYQQIKPSGEGAAPYASG